MVQAFFFTVGVADDPRRVHPGSPMRLEYRQGGGVAATLFGLPFLGIGLFLAWSLVFRGIPRLLEVSWTAGDLVLAPMLSLMLLAVAVSFSAVGTWCIFGRSGVVFDKEAGTVTSWWSLPLVRRSTVSSLAGFTAIGMKRVGGSFRTGPRYAVFLLGRDGSSLDVATTGVPAKAEKLSEEVGHFLGLTVHRP